MAFVYRGLKATLEKHTVTAEEVEQQLVRMQQQTPRFTPVTDRPTCNGDEVVLDYAGFCDGVQFPGGTAEKQTLTLGSGTFIPGFEEQLVGYEPGAKVVVKVTFPEQYHSADLAGKAAEFHCTIHAIRTKGMYQLDDTFAKEVGGCENMEQFRARMHESMQSYVDRQGEMDLQQRLLRQASETLNVRFTEEEIAEAVEDQLNNLSAQLGQQGLSLELYCQFLGTDMDKLREEARESAIAGLKDRRAVERVALLEAIVATDDEKAYALEAVCRQNNMTPEQLRPFLDKEFMEAIERSVITGKVLGLIRDWAVIEEV